jgi:hypothetical protein
MLEYIFPLIFWAIIIYSIFSNVKKQAENAKKVTEAKKTDNLDENAYQQLIEQINLERTSQSQERGTKEVTQRAKKSSERIDIAYNNSEADALQKKQAKKNVKLHEQSTKSFKPPKPEKPSKDGKNAEDDYAAYTQKAKISSLKATFDNAKELRNAFIISEIFKKKF